MSFRAAIITVGGTWEPIVKNLEEAKPQFVLFVVSPGSKPEVQSSIVPKLTYTPQYSCLETPEVGDLADCYERIRQGIPKWLEERGLETQEVYVDITGGTKPMSAGLAMAAAERFSHFSYVTGAERNKRGLGVVKSGTEQVFRTVNPWDKLASRERERSTWLFRNGYAERAAELLQQGAQKCGAELQREMETLAQLAECFADVDRFAFKEASHRYGRYRANLEIIFSHRHDLAAFDMLQKMAAHWESLKTEASAGGAEISGTLRELLANADRRGRQGRYDDAIARLYRATELFVQGKLYDAFGAGLGKVQRDRVPQGQFDNWVKRFGEGREGVYELGLRDAFEGLAFSQNPEHKEIAGRYDSISNHLQKRNNSILAHGLQTCTEGAFTGFWRALLPALEVREEEIPRWPEIDF